MNFAELDLLTVYQLILLGAAIPTLVATIYRVQKWIARYQQLPRIWQIPIKQGLYSIIRRFHAGRMAYAAPPAHSRRAHHRNTDDLGALQDHTEW